MKTKTGTAIAIAALVAIIAVSHEMTYRYELLANSLPPVSTAEVIVPSLPNPAQVCRKPDGDTEILVTLSWCNDGVCQHQCGIYPMDPEESPGATLNRLLKRTM